MSAMRVFAVVGSMGAAMLAMHAGYEAYLAFVSRPVRFGGEIGFIFGIPAAIAAAIATYQLSGGAEWMSRPLLISKLCAFAARSVALACLYFVPVFMISAIVTGALSGNLGTGGFGIGGALGIGLYSALFSLIIGFLPAFVFQVLALLLAHLLCRMIEIEHSRNS